MVCMGSHHPIVDLPGHLPYGWQSHHERNLPAAKCPYELLLPVLYWQCKAVARLIQYPFSSNPADPEAPLTLVQQTTTVFLFTLSVLTQSPTVWNCTWSPPTNLTCPRILRLAPDHERPPIALRYCRVDLSAPMSIVWVRRYWHTEQPGTQTGSHDEGACWIGQLQPEKPDGRIIQFSSHTPLHLEQQVLGRCGWPEILGPLQYSIRSTLPKESNRRSGWAEVGGCGTTLHYTTDPGHSSDR